MKYLLLFVLLVSLAIAFPGYMTEQIPLDLSVTPPTQVTGHQILSYGRNSDTIFAVTSTTPANHQISSPVDGVISVSFTESVDFSSISASSFIVHGEQTGLHAGSFTNDSINSTITFYPDMDFPAGDMVSVILTGDVLSSGGTPLKPHFFKYTIEATSSSSAHFAQDTSYTVQGGALWDIASADLDGDGDIDLAVLTSFPSNIEIWLNDGSGRFTHESSMEDSAYPAEIIARDFDLDGDIDLVTASDGMCFCTVLRYMNNGDATFEKRYVKVLPIAVGELSAEDINLDGYSDLLLTNRFAIDPNLTVMFNSGMGTFPDTTSYTIVPDWVYGVTANDVDNDGDPDISIARWNSTWMVWDGNISCFLNDGTGNCSEVTNSFFDDQVCHMYMNDFDDDGYIDVSSVSRDGVTEAPDPNLTVAYNDSTGIFSDYYITEEESSGLDIMGGDFDGDGDIDLTYILYHDGCQKILLNDGDGVFTECQTITHYTGEIYSKLSMADYNNDGRIDLIFAGWNPAFFNVLFNEDPVGINTDIPGSNLSLNVTPNPFSSTVEIELTGIQESTVPQEITIYDVSGRTVCSLPLSMSRSVTWNGHNSSGEIVPAGLYHCSVIAGNRIITRQLIFLK